MIVYRIEDSEGIGPYNCGHFSRNDEMEWHHADSEDHPLPIFDPELNGMVRGVEYSACDSPAALLQWFQGYLGALEDDGFYVKVYSSPDSLTRVGYNGQVVFTPDISEWITRWPVVDFMDRYL